MKRIIKLTEKQLKEVDNDTFTYLSGSDVSNYDGQTHISVSGKLSDDEYGNPSTTDKISNTLTPQTYSRYGIGVYGRRKNINEEESMDSNNSTKDTDDDNNINNFYKKDELDILGNDVNNDNLTKIPEGVDYKLNLLLDEMNSSKLTPKQQAIVLNKMIEVIECHEIPFSWKKTLMLKLKS